MSGPQDSEDDRRASVACRRLHAFACDLLVAGGASELDAPTVADVLIWGDSHGRHEYGLQRIPELIRRVRAGLLVTPARLEWHEVSDAATVLDAAHGFGQVAGIAALDAAASRATRMGVGVCAVRNSNHFGAAGVYAERAAAVGLVGLIFSNAYPKVAPYGGTTPALGTNPLALGCPTSGAPIVVDLATSAAAGSSIRDALASEASFPGGVTTDQSGSVLLPAAGPKGTALALAVEILTGAMSGGLAGPDVGSIFNTWDRPVGASHFFLVLSPARFGDVAGFVDRVDRTVDAIHASTPAPGFSGVRVPGERGAELARAADRAGIALPVKVAQGLERLADQFGLTPPW